MVRPSVEEEAAMAVEVGVAQQVHEQDALLAHNRRSPFPDHNFQMRHLDHHHRRSCQMQILER